MSTPSLEHPPVLCLRLASGLALLAAAVSLYLLVNTLRAAGDPVGCGQGTGCGEVLQSHWSRLGGVPVSALAVAAYLAVPALTLLPVRRRRLGAEVLAGLLASAAAWFLGLQALVIGAWCAYCVVSHLISLSLAALLLGPFTTNPRSSAAGIAIGVALTGLLAAAQAWSPRSDPVTVVESGALDEQSADQQTVTVLNGALTVRADQAWILGDRLAPTPIVVLFDHACPHCRTTHEAVAQAIAEDPTLCAWMLPVPLSAACNTKGLPDDEAGGRFVDSCERTRLAVAVRQLGGHQAAAAFNRWLMTQTPTPSAADAAKHAATLVDAAALAAALNNRLNDAPGNTFNDAAMRAVYRGPITAFEDHPDLDRLPVVMSPGRPTTGRLNDAADVRRWLAIRP